MVLPTPLTAIIIAIISPSGARAFKSTVLSISRAASRAPSLAMSSSIANNNVMNMEIKNNSVVKKRIGIIGGGASGLATARSFLRANNQPNPNGVQFEVTVLETSKSIGGIWKYDEDETTPKQQPKSRPMYRNLRTNLPKELMAYREFPWGGDGTEASYVTHKQVQQYLENYAKEFNLIDQTNFGCKVDQLKVLPNKDNEQQSEEDSRCNIWPQISLEWLDNTTNQSHQQTFDAVCICNGHYAQPSSPPIRDLDNFTGKVIHAIEYDDPKEYAGQTVLCVGARASGMDIAREISMVANRVYLSDSTCDKKQEFGNVVLMPRTQSVDEDGGVHFSSPNNDDEEEWTVNDLDVIIYCSGYDYSFPFINEESNLELQAASGERRIYPLYEQMWHAKHPSLSFIGLPHSVVPFPLFELQSTAVVSQLTSREGSIPLPSSSDRTVAAERDASSGGPDSPGRVVDTHFLGSYQWDYCRRMAKIAGIYDDSCENYIATNKALYDRSGKERKSMIPGGEDFYRETRFCRKDDEQSYEILYSKIEAVETTTVP